MKPKMPIAKITIPIFDIGLLPNSIPKNNY